VITAEQRNISESNDSVIFPSQDLLNKMPDSFVGASNSFIVIPPSLIKERGMHVTYIHIYCVICKPYVYIVMYILYGDIISLLAINSITPIANILYQNLESFLPSDL